MKTNFKDIAHHYLGSGLEIQVGYRKVISKFLGVKNFTSHSEQISFAYIESNGDKMWTYDYECKPILYPLSCLTEEITVEGYNDGKPFVPLYKLNKMRGVMTSINEYEFADYPTQKWCTWAENSEFYFDTCTLSFYDATCSGISPQLEMFEMLFKWHFNVFNLPEDQFIDKSKI